MEDFSLIRIQGRSYKLDVLIHNINYIITYNYVLNIKIVFVKNIAVIKLAAKKIAEPEFPRRLQKQVYRIPRNMRDAL